MWIQNRNRTLDSDSESATYESESDSDSNLHDSDSKSDSTTHDSESGINVIICHVYVDVSIYI